MSRKYLILTALLAAALALGAGTVAGQDTTVEADIIIDQPDYVDGEPEIEALSNGTIYHVDGDEFRIWLQSADHESITQYGIADGSGSLEYDTAREFYRFEPEGNGTMSLYWDASEGNETVRHEATVQIGETSFVSRTTEDDEEMVAAAESWRNLERQVDSEFPDRETDDVVSSALTKEIFFASPFSSFAADIQGAIIMLVMTPGGLFVLGVLLFAFLGSTYGLMRGYNRLKKQTRDEHQLEREKFEIQKDKTEKIMQQFDFNERLPDDTSQSLRKLLSENPWLASKKIMQMWTPVHVKGVILQSMGQRGYRGIRTDSETTVVGPDEGVPDEADVFDLTELDNSDERDRETIQKISGQDLDLSIFDDSDRIDLSRVHMPIDNRELDDADLIRELQPRFPEDFRDESHMAEALGAVMEMVATHPEYSDAEGFVDERMDILSFNAEIATTLADEADFPPAHTYKRVFYAIADQLDNEAKLDDQVNRYQRDGLGGD